MVRCPPILSASTGTAPASSDGWSRLHARRAFPNFSWRSDGSRLRAELTERRSSRSDRGGVDAVSAGMRSTQDCQFGGRRVAPRKDTAIREHETHWRRASRVHGSWCPSVGLASPAQTRRTDTRLPVRLSLRTSLRARRPLRFLLLASFAEARRCYYRRLIVTPPLVVITRTRAPPDPRVVVNRSLRRPWTVMGKSTLMRPFTVPVSSTAE
jgi:hypothetical protein